MSALTGLALLETITRPGRDRVPEPMVMDDPDGARAFHEAAAHVQLPVYEHNASMMSRLVPDSGTVLDLGSGSGQLAAHLVTGRAYLTVTCVDLSEEMLMLGRDMARRRSLHQMTFIRADITQLADDVVGRPDLVCCNWTLHQLPNREQAITALAQIADIRAKTGCAVWIFDFARLRRSKAMPVLFDVFTPGDNDRLRVDAVASEAAAWTPSEVHDMLAEAGLTELDKAIARPLGIYQTWWTTGIHNQRPSTAWKRPAISEGMAAMADAVIASMNQSTPPDMQGRDGGEHRASTTDRRAK